MPSGIGFALGGLFDGLASGVQTGVNMRNDRTDRKEREDDKKRKEKETVASLWMDTSDHIKAGDITPEDIDARITTLNDIYGFKPSESPFANLKKMATSEDERDRAQAADMAKYAGMNPDETEAFMRLPKKERALATAELIKNKFKPKADHPAQAISTTDANGNPVIKTFDPDTPNAQLPTVSTGGRAPDKPRAPTDTEIKAQMIQKRLGVSTNDAIDLATGMVTIEKDGDGKLMLVNKAAGTAKPLTGSAGAGAAPGDDKPTGDLGVTPGGVKELENVMGGWGHFLGALNRAGDVLGVGRAAPMDSKVSQDLSTLQAVTTATLTTAVPGRDNAQMQNMLKDLTVTPNSLFQGEEGAFDRLTKTRAIVAGEEARLQQYMKQPGLTAAQRGSAAEALGQVRNLKKGYDVFLSKTGAKKPLSSF